MALSTPVVSTRVAYDATTDGIFYFTSSGGSQVVKNRITIRNNTTNVVVYQNIVETYLFQQTVPSGTLTNGVYYNYYFNTYDVDDNISSNSNSVAFYCYSQPTITFTNAPSTNIVNTASYEFTSIYAQAEGELLDYLIYYLYDAQNNEISNSGKLYSALVPPLSFSYMFAGFESGTVYKVKIKGISVNGTLTESELYTFTASYYNPELFSLINLTNNCDDGYTQIQSNVVIVDGVVNPNEYYFMSKIVDEDPADYIQWDTWYTPVDDVISIWTEHYAVDLEGAKTLTFNDGFSIPSGFQYQSWMNPVTDGVLAYMYKTGNEANRIVITLKSGIPSGESTVKNWFEIATEDGTLFDYSNFADAMKTDTVFSLWVEKVGTAYTLTLEVITVGTGSVISWAGTDTYPSVEIHGNIDSLFPLDTLILKNGKYDNLDITSNTDRPYSVTYPVWDYNTILNCNFSTLRGGNLDIVLSQIESIRIKRRTSGSFDWITLYDIPISSADDLNITKQDVGTPTGVDFDYAIVPVLSGGVEGDYIIDSITSQFRWCYLCDGNTTIPFYSNVQMGDITSNPTGGLFAPIGRLKPVIVYNADTDYENGSFSGNILGNNFMDTRLINRQEVGAQVKIAKQFINNKKPKFLKDWNGWCKIVNTNIGSGTNESTDLISGKSIVTFSWVDMGDYDNSSQLSENGLI